MDPSMQSAQAAAEYWVSSVRFNNYFTLIGFAVLFYDYALTFGNEVEFFWKSANASLVSVLFVIVRYYGLLGSLPLIVEYFVDLEDKLQTYHQAFAVSSQAAVAIILVVRTYALYDRSRRILALLIISHVGGAIGCLIGIVTSKSPVDTATPLPFTYRGCNLALTDEQGIHLAVAWAAMLWFDTTIFALTLVRALQMRHTFPGAGGLLEMMFRDGTIYYGIMVASNVSNIITFLITPSDSPLKGMDTTLTNVLSVTLTSRLILNIRDPSHWRARRLEETYATGDDTTAAPSTSYSRYSLTQITSDYDTTTIDDHEDAPWPVRIDDGVSTSTSFSGTDKEIVC